MKKVSVFLSIFTLIIIMRTEGFAHCQIPCGIYDDHMRFTMLREHITTLEKAMNQINELAAEPGKNINQLVRWVNNKDQHADEFSEIVTYYFLAQRIKITEPSDAENFAAYQKKLIILHELMVYSMKAKQTTDLTHISKLRELVDTFEQLYFSPEDLQHIKEHKN